MTTQNKKENQQNVKASFGLSHGSKQKVSHAYTTERTDEIRDEMKRYSFTIPPFL